MKKKTIKKMAGAWLLAFYNVLVNHKISTYSVKFTEYGYVLEFFNNNDKMIKKIIKEVFIWS